ncbi:multiple epidermal growth factor-like domains protein 10 [Crassostrea angulata]|uniref:multiple epidermal growth factor-like domains protein 10 n=1 Tax=Magallana angulata TaxID=2784310 RepID=UPI0022B0D628|nr:multiple epidermal growth factor-like domains protein 10 [Crassostrea angulata]
MILLYSVLFSFCVVPAYSKVCSGQDKTTTCCLGYVWNETLGKCSACNAGYIGKHCSTKCPELYYGQGCLLKCDCTRDQCNHIAGCSKSSSEGMMSLPISPSKTIRVLTINSSTSKVIDNTSNAVSTENKFKQLGNSSSLLAMYYVIVCLVFIAAFLLALYIVLFLYSKC